MIEINLIPDVKRELLKAQKMRNIVTSISILAGIIALGIVVTLIIIVFVVQAIADGVVDQNISDEQKKLEDRSDTLQLLTLQQQLSEISGLENNKYLTSRIIGAVEVIRQNATDPPIQISKLGFNKSSNTVTLEGQAVQGFEAVDAFKKAAERATFVYAGNDGKAIKGVPLLTTEVEVSEGNYGENSEGQRVLRFIVSFALDPNVLKFDSFASKVFKIDGAGKQNVTDSYIQIPSDMFTQKATDEKEKK